MTGPDTEPPAPSRPHEQCPAWCTRSHREDDPPEDRHHVGEPVILPVIVGTPSAVSLTASLEAVDLTVRLGRHLGELVDWVSVEPLELDGQALVLTRESARLLAERLTDLLGGAAGA